jgi:hypothetical protein
MAKIKKRKLSWKPSTSRQVVGYKLYWVQGSGVGYDAPHVKLGNVTEVVLPDHVPDLRSYRGPLEFGLTAVDELGNESNMAVIAAPFQFSVPKPPSELKIETLPEFTTIGDENSMSESAAAKLVRPDFPARDNPMRYKRGSD